ncbi:MAG: hypothetical protein K8E66_13320, partial [Phycisphaerales bacterium]|nr:hypothetical protein [Phycisphaerales bacterium]
MLLLLATPLNAQPASPTLAPPDQQTASPRDQIDQRHKAVVAESERVRGQIAAAGDQAPTHLTHVADLLRRIQLALDEQIDAHELITDADRVLGDLRRSLSDVQASGPAEPPPYSVLLLDSVRN